MKLKNHKFANLFQTITLELPWFWNELRISSGFVWIPIFHLGHVLSLASTSFIEEEHQTPYFMVLISPILPISKIYLKARPCYKCINEISSILTWFSFLVLSQLRMLLKLTLGCHHRPPTHLPDSSKRGWPGFKSCQVQLSVGRCERTHFDWNSQSRKVLESNRW